MKRTLQFAAVSSALLVLLACTGGTTVIVNGLGPGNDAGSLDAQSITPGSPDRDAGDVGPEPDPNPPIQTDDAGTSGDGSYAVQCVTALAANDPAQALRFRADVANGQISLTWLRGWDVPNKRFVRPTDANDTVGTPNKTTWVAQGEGFQASFPGLPIPPAGNSISGRDAVITDLALIVKRGTTALYCSPFAGHLTVPYEYTFAPAQNTCLWYKLVNGSTSVPVFQPSAFVCP